MKTFQSALFCLTVIAATLFSTPVQAGEIIGARQTQIRNQLTQMIQNPDLKAHGITDADLYLQFKIDENGEILLLAINTDNDYLVQFVKEKLHHQKLDLKDVPPNSVYNLRVKFELK